MRFGLAREGRVLIGDEMGVGKTVQAIALASCYRVGFVIEDCHMLGISSCM